MTQLAKSVVHNQVVRLAESRFEATAPGTSDEQRKRVLSKAYAMLTAMQLLELDEETAYDTVVDGKNDMAIDAILVEEPINEYFEVHLFQVKYSVDLDKDKGFAETDVIKMLRSLSVLLKNEPFDVRRHLDLQLTAIKAQIEEFNIPNFNVYLCNNGQGLAPNAQAHIDAFIAESPENAKRYRFRYVNHTDVFRASERAQPVHCALEFSGGFVDEAINFKRAFVGKVPVAQIAELMNQHGDLLLTRNVRDFLGFKRSVNEGIRATLLDAEKRKDFYFLNNGITFVCDKLDYAPGAYGARTRLSHAQIINGGQTSCTIQAVLNDVPDIDFSQTFVLVRAYQVDMDGESDFIHDITTATNSQNAIFARDLHANDPVQRRLEAGLKHYGIHYLRRRDTRRAKADNIRMEVAAECLVTVLLRRPIDAKYRKSLHFTSEFYPEIFDEKRLTPELVWLLNALFKRIENARKHASTERLAAYPFIPLASHYLLLGMHHALTAGQPVTAATVRDLIDTVKGSEFDPLYEQSLETLKQLVDAKMQQPAQRTDAVVITHLFRSETFAKAAWDRFSAEQASH